MKHSLWICILLALLVSGCSQEEMQKNGAASSSEGRVFTTSFEQDDSRTYVEDGHLSRWTEDDRISLFDASTLNCQYAFAGETGDAGGTFFMLSKPEGTGSSLAANYAVYPYDKDMAISSKGVITLSLPSEQHYAENSYGLGDNTMVAVTEDVDDTFLPFKNVGGVFKLQLYGDDVTVKSITLKGDNDEKIAGKATITAAYGGTPVVAMAEDATTFITLDCGEKGVKIGATAEEATAFWMVVPPTTFEKGITITVKDMDGKVFTQTTDKQLTIERNVVKPMAAFEVDFTPYLTFTADALQIYTMSKGVETLEYSINNSKWTELGTNSVEFGGEKGKLRLRGMSSIGTAVDNKENFSNISFGNNTSVACSGDIRTLINYKNYINAETKNARFCRLFLNCTSLTTAPELPATTLASDCYANMFQNTNLITAPNLPAITLAANCYESMFRYCKSLITAPDLPATTLAANCYKHMFGSCKNLKVSPKLPATTLASNCYASMFEGTSLTTAPELPATTLARSCYELMFQGCSHLTVAPELRSTKLADYCYKDMFRACTSLTTAPELPATNLALGCYENMFWGCSKLNYINVKAINFKVNGNLCIQYWVYGVASQGTFVKKAGSSALLKGPSGIPAGWTIKNQ